MKARSKKRPLRQADDSKKVAVAIDWAEQLGLEIYRTTDHCVQIEGHNFWPDKGTIQFEDQPRHRERGLKALARLLNQPPPDAPDRIEFDL